MNDIISTILGLILGFIGALTLVMLVGGFFAIGGLFFLFMRLKAGFDELVVGHNSLVDVVDEITEGPADAVGCEDGRIGFDCGEDEHDDEDDD